MVEVNARGLSDGTARNIAARGGAVALHRRNDAVLHVHRCRHHQHDQQYLREQSLRPRGRVRNQSAIVASRKIKPQAWPNRFSVRRLPPISSANWCDSSPSRGTPSALRQRQRKPDRPPTPRLPAAAARRRKVIRPCYSCQSKSAQIFLRPSRAPRVVDPSGGILLCKLDQVAADQPANAFLGRRMRGEQLPKPPPSSGAMMNRCAVEGVACSGTRLE